MCEVHAAALAVGPSIYHGMLGSHDADDWVESPIRNWCRHENCRVRFRVGSGRSARKSFANHGLLQVPQWLSARNAGVIARESPAGGIQIRHQCSSAAHSAGALPHRARGISSRVLTAFGRVAMHPAGDRLGHAAPGSPEDLIRAHYDDLNSRRLEVAAGRFHPDARLEHITGRIERGPDGFRAFAERWLAAFPDALFSVECIRPRTAVLYDVDLRATGTHRGTLEFYSWTFRPTDVQLRLSARELLHVEGGQILFASLSYDVQDLVRELASVEPQKLLHHLARLKQLGEQLAQAGSNAARQRDVIEQIGRELDIARHVVRPYFR
jgi:hypothetical protein